MDKIEQAISKLFKKHGIIFLYNEKQKLRQLPISQDGRVEVNDFEFNKVLKKVKGLSEHYPKMVYHLTLSQKGI